MPTVRAIVRDAAKDDYRFVSIVLGIVNSPSVPDADDSGRDGRHARPVERGATLARLDARCWRRR